MSSFTRITTGYTDFGPCEVCQEPADNVVNRRRNDGQTERHPRCRRHPFLSAFELELQRAAQKYGKRQRRYR